MNGHLFKLRQEDLSAMAVFESVLTLNMVTHTHTHYIYIYIYITIIITPNTDYHIPRRDWVEAFGFYGFWIRLFGGSSKFRRVDLRSLGLRGPAV